MLSTEAGRAAYARVLAQAIRVYFADGGPMWRLILLRMRPQFSELRLCLGPIVAKGWCGLQPCCTPRCIDTCVTP